MKLKKDKRYTLWNLDLNKGIIVVFSFTYINIKHLHLEAEAYARFFKGGLTFWNRAKNFAMTQPAAE